MDNVWRPLPLTESVPDEVRVGRRSTSLRSCRWSVAGGALVVVVGREGGAVYRLRGGRLEELADLHDEQPRRHDQGGWSQSRFQRHVEKLAEEHLRAVGEELDRLVRRFRGPQVVVIAPEDAWARFSDLLCRTPAARSSAGRTRGSRAGS